MPTKLNHQRQPVEISHPAEIPLDLALATKRAIQEIIELQDIHRTNGDMDWFKELAESLLDDPPAEPAGTNG